MVSTESAVEAKSPEEISLMREGGLIVGQVLHILSRAVTPGVSTAELDRIAEAEIRHRGAKPAFLNYRGYPATLCSSVNSEVVHGIPRKDKVLREGDIISLDLGCVLRGYYADAAITVPVGNISERSRDLVEVARASLARAVEQMWPGKRIGDISNAVQKFVEDRGYSVVREFVGHGIGRALHEAPAVPNYGKAGSGMRLSVGMVLAVEPMVTMRKPEVRVLADGWTAVTVDGSWAAHFEHTIAITEGGPQILTAYSGEDPGPASGQRSS